MGGSSVHRGDDEPVTAARENAPEPYLAGLVLRGRRVVVLGAGQVAARRVPVLLDAGAQIEIIAPTAVGSLQDAATAGRLGWHRRRYAVGDLEQAWYVLVATDDPAANRAASIEAERSRVFCVRSDDRGAATAWTPATRSVDGVTVGVLSGGDPHRSRQVRDALVEVVSRLPYPGATRRTRRSAA